MVGKGDIVRFWDDSWCSETSLCELYPRLSSLTGSKEAKVVEPILIEAL